MKSNKPTHIIISIEEVQSQVDKYEKLLAQCRKLKVESHEMFRAQGFSVIYNMLLTNYTRININDLNDKL